MYSVCISEASGRKHKVTNSSVSDSASDSAGAWLAGITQKQCLVNQCGL